MLRGLLFNFAAIAALLPAALLDLRTRERPDALFWAVLLVAVAGSAAWSVALLGGDWQTGFSVALWLSITTSLVVFVVLAKISRHAWRLTPLLMPYLIGLGLIATVWAQVPGQPLSTAALSGWLGVHIAVSVLTYALLTIAAIAGLAVLIRESALRRKRPLGLIKVLPSVADAESLQLRLLVAGETVLGVGLLTGIGARYVAEGRFLTLDHKTLLSLITFAVIGALLVVHWRSGLPGRRSARYVLAAYLLLTLAYPGVKFITDVLMA